MQKFNWPTKISKPISTTWKRKKKTNEKHRNQRKITNWKFHFIDLLDLQIFYHFSHCKSSELHRVHLTKQKIANKKYNLTELHYVEWFLFSNCNPVGMSTPWFVTWVERITNITLLALYPCVNENFFFVHTTYTDFY